MAQPDYEGCLGLATLIPTFEEELNGELKEFLSSAECAFALVDSVSRAKLLQEIIETKLKGQAQKKVRDKNIEDFEKLVKELRSQFRTQESTALRIEFDSCRQQFKEDVKTFATRLGKIMAKLLQVSTESLDTMVGYEKLEDLLRKQALSRFVAGLNRNLQNVIKARGHTELHAAVIDAIKVEKAFRSRADFYLQNKKPNRGYSSNFNSQNFPKFYCDYCRKAGHTVKSCRGNKPKAIRESGWEKEINCKEGALAELELSPSGTVQIGKASDLQKIKTDIVESGDDEIEIRAKEFRDGKATMSVDAGTELSLIRLSKLHAHVSIAPETTTFNSIGFAPHLTLGRVTFKLQISEKTIWHNFHVIADGCPVGKEGVIGLDFIKKYGIKCYLGDHVAWHGEEIKN